MTNLRQKSKYKFSPTQARTELLCMAALEAAELLLLRSPNANSQLLPHVEALLSGLLQANQDPNSSHALLMRALVSFARIMASDKLQLSGTAWQLMAQSALSQDSKVQAVAQHTLQTLLVGSKAPSGTKAKASTTATTATAHARLMKGVFALYGNCDASSRKALVEKVLLGWPLLTERDLASDALVLPLLQSLAVGISCEASREAGLALLLHTKPSAKALASLHMHLQGMSISHLSTASAHTLLSSLKAFVHQHSSSRAVRIAKGSVTKTDDTEGRLATDPDASEERGLKAKLLTELESMGAGLKPRRTKQAHHGQPGNQASRQPASALTSTHKDAEGEEGLSGLAGMEGDPDLALQQQQAALQGFKEQQIRDLRLHQPLTTARASSAASTHAAATAAGEAATAEGGAVAKQDGVGSRGRKRVQQQQPASSALSLKGTQAGAVKKFTRKK